MGTVPPSVKAGSKEVRSLKVFNQLKNVSEQPLAYGKREMVMNIILEINIPIPATRHFAKEYCF